MRSVQSLFLCSLVFLSPATANASGDKSQMEAAVEAAEKILKRGPAVIPLLDQANLTLPGAMVFVPQAEARAILKAVDSNEHTNLVGIVAPANPAQQWLIAIDFAPVGYVKDFEARKWSADTLLSNLKAGTASANSGRVANGFPEVEIVGWSEPPTYDQSSHKLTWAAKTKRLDNNQTKPLMVNFNTYALGRDGVFEVDLVTSDKLFAGNKIYSRQILDALKYLNGKRYQDFDATTDRVADFGIAALVMGALAKKLSIWAATWAFLAKSITIIGVAAAILAGSLVRMYSISSEQAP